VKLGVIKLGNVDFPRNLYSGSHNLHNGVNFSVTNISIQITNYFLERMHCLLKHKILQSFI
jgi:hypothetical protein